MPAVAPPTFPAVSTPPTTDDPVNFDVRMDTWLMEQTTIIRPSIIALGANAYANALEAAAQATAAGTSASTATTQAGIAAGHVTSAQTASGLANAYAQSAINAPGTSGTSSTSLAIGSGTKILTTQTAKAWVVGQPVTIARTAAPSTTRMYGVISAYNSGAGSISVDVPTDGTWGSGTYSDWTISLTGPRSDLSSSVIPVSGTTVTAVAGGRYSLDNASASTLTLPASPSNGWVVTVYPNNNRYDNVVARNGQSIMGLAEDMVIDDPFISWNFIFITGYGWRLA